LIQKNQKIKPNSNAPRLWAGPRLPLCGNMIFRSLLFLQVVARSAKVYLPRVHVTRCIFFFEKNILADFFQCRRVGTEDNEALIGISSAVTLVEA
jgi:hypothetical protein